MIIALTGKKGSGKDTVADIIERKWPVRLPLYRTAFADKIKQALNMIFGWNASYWLPENKERIDPDWGISPRQAAQHLGTDWGQFGLCSAFPEFQLKTGRLLWAKRTLKDINAKRQPAIITDMRFLHEATLVKREANSYIIQVARSMLDSHDYHPSETEMECIEPDYTILNDGTMEDLKRKVEHIVVKMLYESLNNESPLEPTAVWRGKTTDKRNTG